VYFTMFALVLYVILPAACLAGYRLGHRARARPDEHGRSHAAAWQATLLGLAGLLIGFTFSMAQARFEHRKEIVLSEANNIGTAYLRTRLLDDGQGEPLRALLRRYVDARLVFAEAGGDRARAEASLRESEQVGEQIWTRVSAAGRADRSPATALLVQATNEMLDTGEEHLAAIENPMPWTVLLILVLVTSAAMATLGFECGLEGRMRVLGMVVMPLLLASVIVLVFDLAHPRIGIVRVRDPILTRLKQSF
jgi:hypothetical protein